MPLNEPDPDYPCPSAYPWQTGRADSGAPDQRNIRCDDAGVVIAVNIPAHQARAITDAHNGELPDQQETSV